MNPLALQVLIVASSVSESWLEPSLAKWTQVIDTRKAPEAVTEHDPTGENQPVRIELRVPTSSTPSSEQ